MPFWKFVYPNVSGLLVFGLLDASIKELNIEEGFVHKFSYFLFKSWYILYVTP